MGTEVFPSMLLNPTATRLQHRPNRPREVQRRGQKCCIALFCCPHVVGERPQADSLNVGLLARLLTCGRAEQAIDWGVVVGQEWRLGEGWWGIDSKAL